MVLLLNLNCSPPEEDESSIPEGGHADHPKEEEGIDQHVDEDTGISPIPADKQICSQAWLCS